MPVIRSCEAKHFPDWSLPLGIAYFVYSSYLYFILKRTILRLGETLPTAPSTTPNKVLLKQAWDVSRVVDDYDSWTVWFTQLTAQLVKESPSVSLRSCMNLFDVYPHISIGLFTPALASCWPELPETFQVSILLHSAAGHILRTSHQGRFCSFHSASHIIARRSSRNCALYAGHGGGNGA